MGLIVNGTEYSQFREQFQGGNWNFGNNVGPIKTSTAANCSGLSKSFYPRAGFIQEIPIPSGDYTQNQCVSLPVKNFSGLYALGQAAAGTISGAGTITAILTRIFTGVISFMYAVVSGKAGGTSTAIASMTVNMNAVVSSTATITATATADQ